MTPPLSGSGLLIVAPVFNEERLVDRFLDEIVQLSSRCPVAGLLLVDDGSRDATAARIRERASGFAVPIRLVTLSRNFGHQNACLAGLESALAWHVELGAGWIGLIDSDLQDDPLDFAALLADSKDHDVIYAVRKKRQDGLLMRVLAPLVYKALSFSASLTVPANAGTFSIMRPRVVERICLFCDNDPYLPGLRAWVGFRQKGLPLVRRGRVAGESRVGFLGLVRMTLRAFVLYSNAPLNIIFYTGILTTLAAIVALSIFLLAAVTRGDTLRTFDFIIVLQILALGINVFMLGLLAHMVSRVRDNTSRQRTWVIAESEVLVAGGNLPRPERSP